MISLKFLLLFAFIAIVIGFVPQSFAQFMISGTEQVIHVSINENGDAHVRLELPPVSETIRVKLIEDDFQNLTVKDSEGNDLQHALVNTPSMSAHIFPTRSDVILEYDIENAVENIDGVWTWKYFYPLSTIFSFPEGVDFAFANNNPVPIFDEKKVRCHGCEALLEYVINEPTRIENGEWENKKYPVSIVSLLKTNSFEFDQPTKRIFFVVDDADKHLTMIIPNVLLGGPYQVFNEGELISKHEMPMNETHMILAFKPEAKGTIDVIGSTVIPEFGTIAVLILVVSLISVIAITSKNKINLH